MIDSSPIRFMFVVICLSALLESCEMPERVIVLAGGAQFPLAAMAGRGWKSSPAYLAPLIKTKTKKRGEFQNHF